MVIRKEFRIRLPMAVDEYQIGQLYSVAKSSSQETSNGEGVEVLKNEPFKNEDGLEGQYTEKIYHVGSRLPGWVKAIIPGSALKLEEKAWNAYPYCKTVLKNGYMGEKFTFTIESRHFNDDGQQANVHNLQGDDAKREIDFIDIAADKVEKKDYKESEDPTIVKSEKASRGPLVDAWKEQTPHMTCYKLVTVEFKVWGLQGKVENFLQTFERNLFLKFHRQVYCWLDEWYGMTLEDVRNFENKTKADLEEKLKAGGEADSNNNNADSTSSKSKSRSNSKSDADKGEAKGAKEAV